MANGLARGNTLVIYDFSFCARTFDDKVFSFFNRLLNECRLFYNSRTHTSKMFFFIVISLLFFVYCFYVGGVEILSLVDLGNILITPQRMEDVSCGCG